MAGYYDEITGEYIDTGDVGVTNELDNTSGANQLQGWTFKNGVWTDSQGQTFDTNTGTGSLANLFKGGGIGSILGIAGASGLINKLMGGSGGGGGYAGYQGGIPKYTGSRTMNAIPQTMAVPVTQQNPTGIAARRPGSGGVTYFTPMQYLTAAPAATVPATTETTVKAAGGGMMYGSGGITNLGGYSDGGQLLRGPGDGVSDNIPATIGNKQPARLADGEFVIPARIVSELGNGSTDAGARKLYAMMDRIKATRAKAKNIAANTKADKHLPA